MSDAERLRLPPGLKSLRKRNSFAVRADYFSVMVRRIEHRLAVAYGQTWATHEAMLQAIAQKINDEEPFAPGLRSRFCAQNFPPYLSHDSPNGETSVLAPYIRADLRRRQEEEREAQRQLPQRLSAEQSKLVTGHVWLVTECAGYVANENQVLFSELEALGLRTLEEQARSYDPTLGVPFGAYARHRVRGAMIDHIRSTRGRTIAVGGAKQIENAGRHKSARKSPKESPDDIGIRSTPEVKASTRIRQTHLTPVPNGVIKYYAASGKPLPTGDMSVIEKLMPKLNPRQRAVYRGRVLTHPPVSRVKLARQLGIADETQVSRIERQAQRKMTAWLKVSH